MPREEMNIRQVMLTCDRCGKRETDVKNFASWYVFLFSETGDTLHYEARSPIIFYDESFTQANSVDMALCSKSCAMLRFREQTDLFLQKLKPISQKSNADQLM